MENGDNKPDFYICPICKQRIPVLAGHLTMNQSKAYGITRSAHLRTHGINTKFISPEHRDDAEFIRRYYAATHVDVKGELDQQDADYARHRVSSRTLQILKFLSDNPGMQNARFMAILLKQPYNSLQKTLSRLAERDIVSRPLKGYYELVEKTIEAHDGKFPSHQLSPEDLAKWDGVNIQGHMTTVPEPAEDTLALYIIDMDKKLVKRFTVTKTVLFLLARKTARIMYGTSNDKGEQFKIVLQWEKEKRVRRRGQ